MRVKYRFEAQVVQVLIGADDRSLITSPRKNVRVTFAGFQGDRHSGMTRFSDARAPHYARGTEVRNDRQVSIVSTEEMDEVAARLNLDELRPEWLGANLLLRGVPALTMLPPNTRLVFPQSTVLVVQSENLPCKWAGDAIGSVNARPELGSLFPRHSIHLRGVVACVERPGFISEGDAVRVETPVQTMYSPDSEEFPGPLAGRDSQEIVA
jgi:hypothetical protein